MPQRDVRALFQDVLDACDLIARCTVGSLDDYQADPVARAAVERQFEIVGEAVRRILEAEPALSLELPESADIIRFRNFLAHGYHLIDHAIVFAIARGDAPKLRAKTAALLERHGK
jgi:uncharacterized protein with HEPN domain